MKKEFLHDRKRRKWLFIRTAWSFIRSNLDFFFFPILLVLIYLGLFCLFFSQLQLFFHLGWRSVFSDWHCWGMLMLITWVCNIFYTLTTACLVYLVGQRCLGASCAIRDAVAPVVARFFLLMRHIVIQSTVGVLFSTLEHLSATFERLLLMYFGFSWHLATYFIFPVLLFKEKKAYPAYVRSANIIPRGWRLSFNIIPGIVAVLFLLMLVLYATYFLSNPTIDIFLTYALVSTVALCLYSLTIGHILHVIVTQVLFIYHETGQAVLGFDKQLLDTAFEPRSPRFT